jgi:hypothetical protein
VSFELELLLEELPQVGEGGLHKQQQRREQTVTAVSAKTRPQRNSRPKKKRKKNAP